MTSGKGRKAPGRSPAKRRHAGARGTGRRASPPADRAGLELLDVAIEAANRAAKVIRRGLAGLATLQSREKAPADFVSDVDTGAERAITAFVRREVPEATMLGEELSPGTAAPRQGIVFVADPLDGTTNFLHAYPAFSVSIGVLVDGALLAGVVHDVARNTRYIAVAGAGAFAQAADTGPRRGRSPALRGERLSVSGCDAPTRALIGTGFPFKTLHLLPAYLKQFATVMAHTAGIRRAGSAALDLSDVAAGRFDAFWELSLAPWDIAAGLLLVREAGGIVTDLAGGDAPVAQGAIVAGNPAMHAWLLRAIRESEAPQ